MRVIKAGWKQLIYPYIYIIIYIYVYIYIDLYLYPICSMYGICTIIYLHLGDLLGKCW